MLSLPPWQQLSLHSVMVAAPLAGGSATPPPLPQLASIPEIWTPTSSWRRDTTTGEGVFRAAAINSDVLVTGGVNPGSVDWLHHVASFGYAVPSDKQEATVESVFRRCRFDRACAADAFYETATQYWRNVYDPEELCPLPAVAAADEREELLAWWCRRCWEDRHTKEAAEAVRRSTGLGIGGSNSNLARAFTLASWCRFPTTARRAGHLSCATSGGNTELLRSWQRCREARGWPARAAEAVVAAKRLHPLVREASAEAVGEVVEACCADTRCLTRVLESIGAAEASRLAVWKRASLLFDPSGGTGRSSARRR